MSWTPLTAEEISELRRLAEDRGPYSAVTGDTAALYAALPRLLDEVERSRGTDHPERESPNIGTTALDTLNRAPFTPGGRFLYPRAYNQIHAELKRTRELLKRIDELAALVVIPATSG